MTKVSFPCAIFTAPVLAEIGPGLLALAEKSYRLSPEVRRELTDAAELGMQWRVIQQAKRTSVRTNEHCLDNERSSPVASVPMYNAEVTAKKLGTGVRAVQRRAKRGSLASTLIDGRWLFDAAEIDRLATKGAR